ncbi:MAG: PAS domain S-box protein [Deltaproteobacteria bacterium]|nr:PAS domain S-box protein [Deltaproteobacteria bacterium]
MQDLATQYYLGLTDLDDRIWTVFELMQRLDIKGLFPEVHIRGLVDPEGNEALARTAAKLGLTIHADVPSMLEVQPEINAVAQLNENQEGLVTMRRSLGPEIMLVESKAVGLLWNMIAYERFCLSCQTDLQRAETMLKTIIDEVREDILLLDVNQVVVDVNRNVCARMGLPKQDIILKSSMETWGEGESTCPECESAPFRDVLRTKSKAEALVTRISPEGRLLYFRVYVYPIFNECGEIVQLVEMRRDITSRTYMEKRLQQSERLAAVGELSTYIAHEIRNPLFAIGGFANALLRTQGLPDKAVEKVKIILHESKRLDGILKSILNFARPTQSKDAEIHINDVVEETMSIMGMACEKQGATLVMDLQPDLPMVQGDAEIVKQALINVVKNGLESFEGPGGTITIRTFPEDRFVRVDIEDSGRGIPAQHMEKVFNPFFSTKDKGAGLGLAMTKKIFDELGGTVELASTEGQGTRVSLRLPIVLAVQDGLFQEIRKPA